MGKKVQKSVCIFGADFMLEQVQGIEDEIEGALIGKDIEHIHRLRVASRRLRNAFQCFDDCLPNKKLNTWQDEIRRITRALGNARDLDIQIDLLDQLYQDELDDKFKPGYRRLLLRIKQRRTKAQKKVHKVLSQLQVGDILIKMRAYLEKLADKSKGSYLYTPSLYQRSFSAINNTLEEFLDYEEFIYSPENVEKLHAMRIAGKQLRYSLEIFAPIYNKSLLPHVQVMKDIQDLLGAIHDADVWISWLPKFIEDEEERIEDYFGNTGPLKRLLPGLNHFSEDRKKARAQAYQSFLSIWNTLQAEGAWEDLKGIIGAPINIEAALEHLAEEETFDADESDDSQDEPIAMVEEPSETLPSDPSAPDPGQTS